MRELPMAATGGDKVPAILSQQPQHKTDFDDRNGGAPRIMPPQDARLTLTKRFARFPNLSPRRHTPAPPDMGPRSSL